MENIKEIEAHLWNYIDGFTDTSESKAIEKRIKENNGWSEKYNELLQLHNTIRAIELEQPSLRFAKNVMDEIENYVVTVAAKNFINYNIINSIAAFFFITIGGFLAYGLLQSENQPTKTYNQGKEISEVDFTGLFNNHYINIFIGLNIILALMLLDRYLNSKKSKSLHS